MSSRSYSIIQRSPDLGGGWKLVLFDAKGEAGGGVFPIEPYMPEATRLADVSDKPIPDIASDLAYLDAYEQGESFCAAPIDQ